MAFEQRDLDNLSDELKSFTEGLRKFSSGGSGNIGGTGGSPSNSFDKGTIKIVNALGILGAQLNKNTQNKQQQKKYLDDFNKQVEKATKNQEENNKKTETENKISDETVKVKTKVLSIEEQKLKKEKAFEKLLERKLKNANKEENAFGKYWDRLERSDAVTKSLSDKFVDLAGNSVGLQASFRVAATAFDAAQKSVSQYTSAIYNGERGALASAKAISTFTNTLATGIGNVISVLSFFVPGGLFVKGLMLLGGQIFPKLIEGATKYNELASEQADNLYKSFMELGKGGVNLAGGLTETFETMQKFGMSMSEATQFTSMLAGSAKDLKYLGATAGQGAKEFSKVAGSLYKSDVGRQLELMGVSAEEQRESALKFMSIQARTGQIQGKNTADLVKASAAFTKELDLAATLSGNTRKEQMEAREMALSDERFRAAMDEAVQSGDKDRIAELEKANAMAAQLKSAGDEQGAAGVLQLAASRGALTTDASIAAQMQYGAGDFIFDRSKGVGDIGEIMGGMSANAKRQNAALNPINALIGNVGAMQTTGVGSREQIARNEALKAAIETARKEKGFKGTADEFLQSEKGKRALEADPKLKAQTDLRRTQQNTAMMMDSFVNSFYDTSKINEAAANVFKAAVETFGGKKVEVAGGGLSTGVTNSSPSLSATQSAPMATTGGGAAVGGRSTSGSANTRPGSLRDRAEKANAARAAGGASGAAPAGQQSSLDVLNFGGASGSRENFLQLSPDIQQKVLAAGAEYHSLTGNKLTVNSAFRTYEKQKELYDTWIAGGKQGMPVAIPGNSRHESGRAIDIEQGKGDAAAIAALTKQGLSQEVSGDPVHFQARTGGIFKGPSTGYNVELHGDEMVIPANEGVSKQTLNSSVFNQDSSAMDNMMSMFEQMNYKYDQMIDLMSRSTDNSDKLVMATT